MEISLQREVLSTEKFLGETSRSIQVEGDLSLPQGTPPCDRILFCRSTIKDLQVIAVDEAVRVEGLLEVEMQYFSPRPDEEAAVRGEHLAFWNKENGKALSFTHVIPMEGVVEGAAVEAVATVAELSINPIDESSFECRAELDLTTRAGLLTEMEVATEISAAAPESLETSTEILQIETPAAKVQAEVPVNAVLALPETKPDLVRIIARHVRPTGVSVEIIRGRAIVEGRLEIDSVYVSRNQDGGQGIESARWGSEGRTPVGFEAFIDLQEQDPEAVIEARADLEWLSLTAIGPREMKLEAMVRASVESFNRRQVTVVTELLPGPDQLVDIQQTEAFYRNLAGVGEQEIIVETALELPVSRPDLDRVLMTTVEPSRLTAQTAQGKCLIEGWLDVNMLYTAYEPGGTEQTLAAAEWTRGSGTGVVIADVLEIPEASPEFEAALTWRLDSVSVEQQSPRTLHLIVRILAKVNITESRYVSAITDAALVPLGPVPGRPSMLFYVVQDGDTPWTIARRYETTVEALIRTNEIVDPSALKIGGKLLIPRSPVAV